VMNCRARPCRHCRANEVVQWHSRWKKQDRRQIKIQMIQKLNTTQKKQTMQNTAKQKYLGLVT